MAASYEPGGFTGRRKVVLRNFAATLNAAVFSALQGLLTGVYFQKVSSVAFCFPCSYGGFSTGPNTGGGAGGRRGGSGRSARAPSLEEYVLPPNAGRLPVDLPPGTVVKKPPEKLVQLIAQVIHESPCQVLRVSHVYTALQ